MVGTAYPLRDICKISRNLDGTEVDYAREGLNKGFKFNNPNGKDACGCGESFNV